MKRLLAAGSGDIYQICHVARGLERGRQHNAEFTLIEWYRAGFTLERLMDEVEALVRAGAGPGRRADARASASRYAEAFVRELGIDPLTASHCTSCEAARALRRCGLSSRSAPRTAERDELLELLMGARIGPRLGRNALTFIHRYPASQAALARLDPQDPRCALRFELYCEGIELANGFHELASAPEQRARFEQDLAERQRRGLPAHALGRAPARRAGSRPARLRRRRPRLRPPADARHRRAATSTKCSPFPRPSAQPRGTAGSHEPRHPPATTSRDKAADYAALAQRAARRCWPTSTT